MILLLLTLATAQADGPSDYQMLCASCHGPTGGGDGPAAVALNPKPAHFSDPAFWASRDDEHLKKTIKEGGVATGRSPMMPAWGAALSDAQIDAVLAYIRTFEKPAEPTQ